jgi:SecD/SecF fusion protein
MRKRFRWRMVIVVVALLLAAWYLYPTIRLSLLSAEAREQMDPVALINLEKKTIKLGLDLKGGMHVVMEVDRSNLTTSEAEDALDRALEILRNRVDEFGVAEPVIQKEGSDRIIVELPGIQDEARAKNLIGRTALLEFKLVQDPEVFHSVLQKIDRALVAADTLSEGNHESAEPSDESSPPEEPAETAPELFEEELTPEEETAPEDILAEKPFSAYLLGMGQEKNQPPSDYFVRPDDYARVNAMLNEPIVQAQVPSDAELVWGSEDEEIQNNKFRRLYLLKKQAEFTGKTLKNATVEIGRGMDLKTANKPYVTLELNKEGARAMARTSAANIGKRLAIVLDHHVFSAPVIEEKIPTGQARITGGFDMDEARDLAIVLRAGALPAPVEIIEERTVGPSLGADSIHTGIRAALIGLAIVVLFMLIYYKFAGLIADLALVINIFFVMAVLAGLGATLTLPGIAGIILTIGMSVDANVLIFERIREELRAGKTVLASIDSGYSRAFRTILDANVTTLITAIVLYQFGTGPIKGFAVTLSIGIVASMFTAIVITRLIFHFLYEPRPQAKISI